MYGVALWQRFACREEGVEPVEPDAAVAADRVRDDREEQYQSHRGEAELGADERAIGIGLYAGHH